MRCQVFTAALIAFTFTFKSVQSKVFDPCEFAQELTKPVYNVSFWQVPTWVCLAHHATGLNTSYDSSGFHGIFRISGDHWCNECGLPCSKLMDEYLMDDVQCAVHVVYERHSTTKEDGFSAWGSYYSNFCREPWKDLKLHDCHKVWKLMILRVPTSLASFSESRRRMSNITEEQEELLEEVLTTTPHPLNVTSMADTWALHHLIFGDAGLLIFLLLCILGVAAGIEAWRRYELPFSQICR